MILSYAPRWLRFGSCFLLVLLTACDRGTLEVTNLNPVPVMVAIRYQWSADSVATQGWYRLAAGESRKFTREFRGVPPTFAVYAHTAGDPALMRWLHGQSQDGPGRRYFSGPVPGAVSRQAFIFNARVDSDAAAAGGELVGFAAVPPLKEGRRRHRVVLKDELFGEVYAAAARNPKRDSLKGAASRMARLEAALFQQHWFAKTFKDPATEYPFGLALLQDRNGPFIVGVDVVQAPAATIWGDTYPLSRGDRLLSLDGRSVYGTEDLLSVLWDHATDIDGGIRKTMEFTALRDGQRVTGKATYFFNEAHFQRSDREARRATVIAGLDGVVMGFGCQLGSLVGSAEMSRRRRSWSCQQDKARLRQLYQKNYATGEMLSFLVPLGGSLNGFKAARGARRARAARGVFTSGAVYTVVRTAAGTVNRASPLDGPGEMVLEGVKDLSLDFGIQVVFAADVPWRAWNRTTPE